MVMSITSSCWLELAERRCVGVGPSRIPPIAWLPPQRLPPDGGLPRRAVGSPTPEKGVRGGGFHLYFLFSFFFLFLFRFGFLLFFTSTSFSSSLGATTVANVRVPTGDGSRE